MVGFRVSPQVIRETTTYSYMDVGCAVLAAVIYGGINGALDSTFVAATLIAQ